MKPHKILLLCCFVFLCFSASAKKRVHKADTTDYTNCRLRYFFLEPVALIDVYNSPSIRLGTEYALGKHYAADATLGIYGGGYYCVKFEMKRYLWVYEKERYYLSLQYFYKHNDMSVYDNSNSLPKGAPGYDINYSVNKYATYLNVNAGIVTFHKHHFIIDGYCGLGVRYHVVALENISSTQIDDRYHNHESVIDNFTNNDDRGWRLNISLGLRIGFRY